ncbi:DNA phosphorothioation-dependent restriction protein DptG [Azotobacter salinestris]|uniref:DNA phosphorothioation-dependent restriction protein DptG n=1 Tax=Azotobacter salinestris TaxID=69964 RepID=UPI0032E0296A
MSIKENLYSAIQQKVRTNNFVNEYLTFRQRATEPAPLYIAGKLVSVAMKKRIHSGYGQESFSANCMARLAEKIQNIEFEGILREMYFENDSKGLFEVSPEFLLFKSMESASGNAKYLGHVLASVLASSEAAIKIKSKDVNFVEKELINEFEKIIEDSAPESQVENYLPFLSNAFIKDFNLLCQYPGYMMQSIKPFICLYNFLYSAQLALNLNEWRSIPKSKPLFFILDTERASIERKRVRESFPRLIEKVGDLFPVLSALEYLNQPDSKTAKRYPLWQLYNYIQVQDLAEQDAIGASLRGFLKAYRESRQRDALDYYAITTPAEVIDAILKTAKEIFSQPKSGQLTVNRKVVSIFENEVALHFIQSRGRAGRVLIINQDYLLLLTNLAIGLEEQLQFQSLLKAFEDRGVWLDQQSQQALIDFYDRVGNLERMSDSGDAVYVRKTI